MYVEEAEYTENHHSLDEEFWGGFSDLWVKYVKSTKQRKRPKVQIQMNSIKLMWRQFQCQMKNEKKELEHQWMKMIKAIIHESGKYKLQLELVDVLL